MLSPLLSALAPAKADELNASAKRTRLQVLAPTMALAVGFLLERISQIALVLLLLMYR
jgi:hypothetical protein